MEKFFKSQLLNTILLQRFHKINQTVLFLLTAIMIITVAGAAEPKEGLHVPHFSVRQTGKQPCRYEVYDGETKVCEVNDASLTHIVHQARLSPPLVADAYRMDGVVMPWVLDGDWEKSRLNLSVSENGVSELRMDGVWEAKDKRHTQSVLMTISFSRERNSYVYDITSRFTLNRAKSDKYHRPWGLRVGQPLDPYTDANFGPQLPSQAAAKKWNKRFHYFVVQARQFSRRFEHAPIPFEGYLAIPLNRSYATGAYRWYPAKDGLWCFLDNPEGNPAIQFLGDTYQLMYFSICKWGYDIHNFYITQDNFDGPGDGYIPYTLPADSTYEVHYRLFQLTGDETKKIMDRMVVQPFTEKQLQIVRDFEPVLGLENTFDQHLDPDKPANGESDPWFWEPHAGGGNEGNWTQNQPRKQECVWDRAEGRTDTNSLRVMRDAGGTSFWQGRVGPSQRYEWEPGKRFAVRGFVRTKGVSGRGAAIVLRFWRGGGTSLKEHNYESQFLKGDADWTEIRVETDKAPDDIFKLPVNCDIRLQLDGLGEVWFDDVQLSVIQ